MDLNREIAMQGGSIYSRLVRQGLEIELNDCLIVAASLSLGIPNLITRNTEHFERIGEINTLTPEDLGFK